MKLPAVFTVAVLTHNLRAVPTVLISHLTLLVRHTHTAPITVSTEFALRPCAPCDCTNWVVTPCSILTSLIQPWSSSAPCTLCPVYHGTSRVPLECRHVSCFIDHHLTSPHHLIDFITLSFNPVTLFVFISWHYNSQLTSLTIFLLIPCIIFVIVWPFYQILTNFYAIKFLKWSPD